MARKHFVYLLIFSNGRVYVGMSQTCPRGLYTTRWRAHKRAAATGQSTPVYRAWREVGEPQFEIVAEFDNRQECADAEISTIAFLEAQNGGGYNVLAGGDGPDELVKLHHRRWLDAGGREHLAQKVREQYSKPGVREAASARTKAQMTPEARAHLSEVHTGRADPRSAEGKERQRAAVKAYLATPEGKASARRGQAAARANPETVAKMNAGLASWRSSEGNAENCRRIAALSAKACSRAVRDNDTGIEYPSQRAMAKALGVSDAIITRRVQMGRATRLTAPDAESKS